ncbi:MAG: hypothetical protein II274_01250 [Alistipes sp.]|nr:hypothetical protein [Alistipes sp.]
MTQKFYHIYRSQAESFTGALEELLTSITSHPTKPLRIIFFGHTENNQEYATQLSEIEKSVNEHFNQKPMVAYVAQAPLCSTLAAEVMSVAESVFNRAVFHEDYIRIDDEILSGGLHTTLSQGIDAQAETIFTRMSEIPRAEGVEINDIVRQWNYIERITHMDANGQHYQLFNDARSSFYNKCQWSNGYPAATGIGTQAGGVVVVFDAIKSSEQCSTPIDNPLQISAHAYSQQVLINSIDTHKTTPKFERARHIDGTEPIIHISGTAAIRGEASCEQDIIGQTALTMENIDYLTSVENQSSSGVKQPHEMEYATSRIYIKHRNNLQQVSEWMAEHYPTTPALYLWADICRDELLIEIEGVATKKI